MTVEAKGTNHILALLEAAGKGHLEVVRFLVSEGKANVDSKDANGTALIVAACNGHLDVVRYLVSEAKANVEAKNAGGFTALMLAACHGHLEVVRLLVHKGKANVEGKGVSGSTALMFAACHGHLEVVRLLVSEGKANVEAKDASGTALIVAACNGHLDVVCFLVYEGKANVEAKDPNGSTALLEAADKGHLEVARFLVSEGKSNVEAKADDGVTALMMAAGLGQLELVRFLVSEGKANVEAKGATGVTALMLAACHGHLEVVRLLVHEGKANVEVTDANGVTALKAALLDSQLEVVRFLAFNAAASLDAALAWAKERGFDDGDGAMILKREQIRRSVDLAGARQEADECAKAAEAELLADESSGPGTTSGTGSKRSRNRQGKRPLYEADPILLDLQRSQKLTCTLSGEKDGPSPKGGSSSDCQAGALYEDSNVSVLKAKLRMQSELIHELRAFIDEKNQECNELSHLNQDLLEEVRTLRADCEALAEMHDKLAQEKGAAEQKLESIRKTRSSKMAAFQTEIYPAMAEAGKWLVDHRDPLPLHQRLEIPVLCLRWTHASIDRKMMFGHGGEDDQSIFKLVDRLQRGAKTPGAIDEPIDVVTHRGMFCAMSKRRLTALMMYQALHRDVLVKAWCKICSGDTERFENANSTGNSGLGVDTSEGKSQHYGAPLLQHAEYASHELNAVAARRAAEEDLVSLLHRLRARRSTREPDGRSFTLTMGSERSAPGRARCARDRRPDPP